jgi:hypothetical protein
MPTILLGSGGPRRWFSRRLIAAIGLLGTAVLFGCGSSSHDKPVITSHPAANPAPVAPPITTDRGEIFNVTITTNAGQILVDKLEIEFNRRRGIHELYGFYFNSYNQMARLPFATLKRIDFLRQMPTHEFEQAIIGREDQNLLPQNAFEVKLTYRDDRQESFYAVIPMFRGEKDMNLWEYPMDSRNNPIQYIEFDR